MFRRAVRVMTLGGVDVRLDPSLVLLVALLTWVLHERLGLRFPPVAALALALLTSLLLLLSILAHELGHAYAARRRGLAVGGITLFALGGATELGGHGRSAREELAVAFSGPWVSIVIAATAGIVATSAERLPAGDVAAAVGIVAGLVGWLNLGLAAFNLLPAAPLDGGRVLHALLWRAMHDRRRASLVTGVLGVALGVALVVLGARTMLSGVDLVPGIATLAVGAFLLVGADGERRRERHGRHEGHRTQGTAETTAASSTTSIGRSGPRRPDLGRSALASASVAVVAIAALSVPMPFVEYRPGGAVPIEPLVAITGADTTPLEGRTALLTVRLSRPTPVQLLAARLDGDRELLPLTRVYPQGVDRQVHLARERERFNLQFEVAAAVGARAAGIPFEVVTAVVVIEVDPDGPSAGRLTPGDVVLDVDGVPLTSGAALAELVRGSPAGSPLVLRIEHAGGERDQPVIPEVAPGGTAPRIGVVVQTAVDRLVLPIGIALTPDVRIGGPSAGLMVGLTVYDLLAEEDLLRGRQVAGTGTLDVDGVVGAVGGVPEKTLAAIAAGYDVLLVPVAETAVAERVANGRITVIGVATLDDAIEGLRRPS